MWKFKSSGFYSKGEREKYGTEGMWLTDDQEEEEEEGKKRE